MFENLLMNDPALDLEQTETTVIVANEIREAPKDPDKLAKDWANRIEAARKHWDKFYKRCEHNRTLVNGFDWSADVDSDGIVPLRANLIGAAIDSVLPSLYARTPEMSVVPVRKADIESKSLEQFTETLGIVLNTYLDRGRLKARGKAAVRAALTCSYGILKVVYQRDLEEDPIIMGRLQDAQDNLARIDGLLSRIADDESEHDRLEVLRSQLEQTVEGLKHDAEARRMDGLVIDRILTDQLIIDPTVTQFEDYTQADWMCQVVPMRRSTVEETYKIKIPHARVYESSIDKALSVSSSKAGMKAEGATEISEDDQVCVLEVWDRISQRVYTMAEGCDYFIREPYSPEKVGARWYPFFLLSYKSTDGRFVSESLVDLMEKLQAEHNVTRETFVAHRKLCKPGYIASADVDDRSIQRFTDSVLGEVTVLRNAEGQDIRTMIQPKSYPPIDPAVYDTTLIRQDIEQCTGLQDAMRSTVVQAKTATEAQIMQQGLSGRVASFRDDVEDWLQEIAQYSAQVLLRELTEVDVARIMGDPVTQVDPLSGVAIVVSRPYEWKSDLSAEEVNRLIRIKITAGSTGAPDKLSQQENWQKILPTLQGIVQMLYQLKPQGIDTGPIEALLRETVKRFDDRIDADELIPQIQMPQVMPGAMGGGAPQQAGIEGAVGAQAQAEQQQQQDALPGTENMPPVRQMVQQLVQP